MRNFIKLPVLRRLALAGAGVAMLLLAPATAAFAKTQIAAYPVLSLDGLVPGPAEDNDRVTGKRVQLASQPGDAGSTSVDSRPSSNHDYTLNIRIVPWLAQPDGRATLGSLGTDVDLHDDLGLESYKVNPAGSANLRFGRHDIWFDALGVDISESSTVSRTITFGSLTIPTNRAVRSEVDIQLYDFRYGYSFFDVPKNGFRFGPTVGVAYLDIDVRVTDLVTSSSDSLSERLPLPRLGLQGAVPFGDFEIGAKVSGLYVEYGDFEGYTVEGDVSLAWRPLRNVGLVAGYRRSGRISNTITINST